MKIDRRKRRALLVASSTAAVTVAAPAAVEPVEAAYYTPWTRNQAYNMASTGQGEAYEFGNSHWIDDNNWANDIGADCSGYSGKVWQNSATFKASNVNYWYVSTLDWYNGTVDSSYNISLFDMNRSIVMDVFVYRDDKDPDAPGKHMGVFEGSLDSSNNFKTWEARAEHLGIGYDYRSLSTLNVWGAKRYKRVNW